MVGAQIRQNIHRLTVRCLHPTIIIKNKWYIAFFSTANKYESVHSYKIGNLIGSYPLSMYLPLFNQDDAAILGY